jgi:ribonuclease HI
LSITVIVDGASRGQGVTPGVSGEGAVGVVIYKNDKLIGKFGRGLGKATNNAAELEAILTGLLLCWANPELSDPIIYSDSQLACKLVNKEWICSNIALRPILLSIQEIQEVELKLQEMAYTNPPPPPNNIEIKHDLKEISFSPNINTLESISLKKPNQVYYEIYKEAKNKAKQMKKDALYAFLE